MQIWTIRDILSWTTNYFQAKGIATPRLDAEVLLSACLGIDRLHLYVDFEKPLQQHELANFRSFVKRRGNREPIAYITGNKEFYSLPFTVSPSVLIPRPDSEILVEWACELLAPLAKESSDITICDIGTGTGALLYAIGKQIPAANLIGTDISEAALKTARQNAENLGLADRVTLFRADLIPPGLIRPRSLTCIVSNPPYIPTGVIPTLEPEVRMFEPVLALDGGSDGLACYRRMIPLFIEFLAKNGIILVETGHDQAARVKDLFQSTQAYSPCESRKDYAGIERVVAAWRMADSDQD